MKGCGAWIVVCALAAAAGGCAVGADGSGDDTGYVVEAGSEGGGPARGHDSGGVVPGADAGAPPGIDAATGDDSGAPPGDGGGGMDGPSGGIPCTSPDSCGASATGLGTLSGDTSGSPVNASGATSEWLVLDATENDSSPLAVPMKLAVSLTSPPGENFDLYLYLAGDPSSIDCATVSGSSTKAAGQVDTVNLTWGETGTFANGSDDSAHVMVEVRSASGNTCASGATWTLTAHGH